VDQTAAELGWPYGTVCVRLTRGKERLRGRLVKRGMAMSAGAVSAILAPETAAAGLLAALAQTALRLCFVSAPSGTPAVLAENFVRGQLLNRAKWVLALLVAVGTATAGTRVLLSPDAPELPASLGPTSSGLGTGAEGPIRADPDGDPLPRGAIFRVGSARFRHGGLISALAYSPDGRTVTTLVNTCELTGLVRTWDAATGRPRDTFCGGAATASTLLAALSPDGRFAAAYEPLSARTFAGGRITVRDLSGGAIRQSLAVPEGPEIFALAISNDGSRLAAARAGEVDPLLVWDVAVNKLRRLPAAGWLVQGTQLQIALSPDGKLLAGIDTLRNIRLWDVESGEERRPPSLNGSDFSALSFSGDGRRLVCGGIAGQIGVWDVHSGKLLRSFSARGSRPPPGKIGSSDRDGRPSPMLATMQKLNGVTSLAASFDGSLVACCCDEALCLWDADTGQERGRFHPVDLHSPGQIALAFSPDGKWLAAGDSSAQVKVWDVATGRRLQCTDEPDLSHPAKDTQCFATISPDGAIAATYRSGLIHFWDVRTGKAIGSISAGNTVGERSQPITFSADGAFLLKPYHWVRLSDAVPGPADQNLNWAVYPLPGVPEGTVLRGRLMGVHCNNFRLMRRVARELLPGPGDPGSVRRPLALSPDGKIVAWESSDPPLNPLSGVISLRDWVTGKEVCRIRCPGACRSASFAPDGQSIAVAGVSYVGRWNTSSGNETWKARNTFPVTPLLPDVDRPLAFSPDGALLATGDENCNICLWNAATGQVAHTLKGHGGPITSLAFSSDGRRLISGSADTTALVWDVTSVAADPRRSAAKGRHSD